MSTYRDPEDRPSRREAAELDAWDQQATKVRLDREAGARARGEYVPDPVTALDGLTIALTLGQHGIHHVTVTPIRADVYALDGPTLDQLEAVEAALGALYEVAGRHGRVWVRSLEPLRF